MDQTHMNNLCQNIKIYRKRLNLTQEELANKLGYTKQAISNWETGKNLPSPEDIEKIAQILEVDQNVLIKKREPNAGNIHDLELIEILPIKDKIETFVLFYKNNVYDQWEAWIRDMDFPSMILSELCCAKHNDFLTFKDGFLEKVDEAIELARDQMNFLRFNDEDILSAKRMLEAIEEIAENPPESTN